jgi:hypothetical protein
MMFDESIQYETRTGTYRWDKRGYIRKVVKDGIDHTIKDCADDMAVIQKMHVGFKVPLLVDARLIRSADQESRNFWSSAEFGQYIKAVGVITGNSPIVNMIGNILMAVRKPLVPLKLCVSEEAAMPWIEWFLDDEHESPPTSVRIF